LFTITVRVFIFIVWDTPTRNWDPMKRQPSIQLQLQHLINNITPTEFILEVGDSSKILRFQMADMLWLDTCDWPITVYRASLTMMRRMLMVDRYISDYASSHVGITYYFRLRVILVRTVAIPYSTLCRRNRFSSLASTGIKAIFFVW